MTPLVITRYLHFIGVFAIVGAIVAEQFMVSSCMTRRQLQRVARVDALYGIGAVLVLVAGLLLWFALGKSAIFYSRNWIFHTKLTLFLIMGLASIYPTVFFLKNRKGDNLDESVQVPKSIFILLKLELALLLLIPLLATLMSLGIGTF